MTKLVEFEKKQLRDSVPEFNIGDTVDVHVRIVEGSKTRVQVFTGTVISRKGTANRETFTVRRIVASEGVERVFPLHSPWIEAINVKRHGKVRRAKLYYLRDRVGKATKVKEKIGADRGGKKKAAKAAPKKGADAPEEPQPVGSA
ncbi:MAG: 50S ribosomal protein L19 [Planctomycetota bacterium]